jgi:transcriptional regulator with XRE-family HTH domain
MLKLPNDILGEIAARARTRRKEMSLSQESLASRSGVSFGSVKRFETTGKISLESLLKLAVTLNALKDFDAIFAEGSPEGRPLDDILTNANKKKSLKL